MPWTLIGSKANSQLQEKLLIDFGVALESLSFQTLHHHLLTSGKQLDNLF
ncbi:MAG: hypothetical protein LDL41_25555 [Coleofasciculus sp. S288]|nr:hypothetical protein [Coleofasciculus sp. S288]